MKKLIYFSALLFWTSMFLIFISLREVATGWLWIIYFIGSVLSIVTVTSIWAHYNTKGSKWK